MTSVLVDLPDYPHYLVVDRSGVTMVVFRPARRRPGRVHREIDWLLHTLAAWK